MAKCSSFSILSGCNPAKIILKRWASRRLSNDRGFSSYSRIGELGDLRCPRAGCISHWLRPRVRATILSVAPLGEYHGQTSECRGRKRTKNSGSGIPRDDGCRKDGSHRLLGGLQGSPAESTCKGPTSQRDRPRVSGIRLGRDRS
jgi:hypothetical protein